jgi:4-hydroxy-tetrahydrodipicolinate synthase
MFEGILTALVTPFRDGHVDEDALRELVDFQIKSGVQGLVPCGSTGESATCSHEEHHRVVEIVVEAAKDQVHVVAGTGSNSTREAIELTRHAKEAGAHGALLISPYYNKPTQQGIYEHYSLIASETKLPIVVYNIPGRTGSNIEPATLARLARHPYIVGVKEACGDIDQIAHVVANAQGDFNVLSGDDAMMLPLLAVGGRGCISTTSNVAPRRMGDLYEAFQCRDIDQARKIHFEMLPLFDVLFCETNPIPVKAALEMMGRIGPEIRLPLTPLTDSNRVALRQTLTDLGLVQ